MHKFEGEEEEVGGVGSAKLLLWLGKLSFFTLFSSGFGLLVPACPGGYPPLWGSQLQFYGPKTLKRWKLGGQKDWWVSGGQESRLIPC